MIAVGQESADVVSLSMRSRDGQPLETALPGQYIVLRLPRPGGGPPLFRSYSLSGPLSTEQYRVSVKIEPQGSAGTWLREHVRVGDSLDVSSPRGSFILKLTTGLSFYSVQESVLHSFSRCCTHWLSARPMRQVVWVREQILPSTVTSKGTMKTPGFQRESYGISL